MAVGMVGGNISDGGAGPLVLATSGGPLYILGCQVFSLFSGLCMWG